MSNALRRVARPVAAAVTRRWRPGSRLFLVGEGTGWSVDHDMEELAWIAGRLGVEPADRRFLNASQDQAVFYGSQFALLHDPWTPSPHRLGTAYFHGRPGTPGMPEFDECYRVLSEHHAELLRVQVSHSELRDLVLSTGIDAAKVFLIPIGVDPAHFEAQTPASRARVRAELDLPADAFVVGSFHKDGVGFGEGLEPKLIKGPDVLLETLELLRDRVAGLHVLLAGPARGYVRAGLDRLGIPYRHRLLDRYEQVGPLYQALDAYVVSSRQEGGPKGVFEALASGVPLVTTRVGQAMDMIRSSENGWLVEVDDVDGLAHALADIAGRPPELNAVIAAGLETAAANTYEAQLPLWRAFFDGFVEAR